MATITSLEYVVFASKTGKETHGFLIQDGVEEELVRDLPELNENTGDFDLLLFAWKKVALHNEIVKTMLQTIEDNRSGIKINGTLYEWEAIAPCFDEPEEPEFKEYNLISDADGNDNHPIVAENYEKALETALNYLGYHLCQTAKPE